MTAAPWLLFCKGTGLTGTRVPFFVCFDFRYSVSPGVCMLSSHLRLVPARVRLVHSLVRSPSCSFMDLKALVSSLNDFASLSFAESWDNVGLLVEPSPPHTVNTLFLTNDLTEEVMEEALQKKADFILSYHPPIFRPMKRITWKTWKERLVIRALENRIAIYSPHTAYDAAPQGVNNWLAKGLGETLFFSPVSSFPCKCFEVLGRLFNSLHCFRVGSLLCMQNIF